MLGCLILTLVSSAQCDPQQPRIGISGRLQDSCCVSECIMLISDMVHQLISSYAAARHLVSEVMGVARVSHLWLQVHVSCCISDIYDAQQLRLRCSTSFFLYWVGSIRMLLLYRQQYSHSKICTLAETPTPHLHDASFPSLSSRRST